MTASTLRTFVFVTGAMIAMGLAQAQQPAPSPKPAAQTAAPAISAAAGSTQKPAGGTSANGSESAKAAASAPSQKADPDAQLMKDAVNAGFKPQKIRGTQMFCRTAIELGSSFPVRTCYDADQVKVKIHEYAEERQQLEQMRSVGQPGP